MAANRKPRKKYRPRPVQTWLPPDLRSTIEIMGFFFSDKLAAGTFDEIDSNTVAYLLNVANYMAIQGENEAMTDITDRAIDAYRGIRRRHERSKKYGASGPELVTLRETMPAISAYFTHSPQHRIEAAVRHVLRVNEKMRAAGYLYAEPGKDGALRNVERLTA